MTIAIGLATIVYVAVSIGVFGTLTVTEVIKAGETAIAEAARPQLGDFGFKLMAIVALLSTAGATNATLYASGNLTGMLAEEGLFPALFGSHSALGRKGGLILTTGFVLVVANFVDLSSIASVGSAVSLMVFLLIGLAGWQRRADTGSNAAIVLLAVAVIGVVLAFFAVDTIRNDPWSFVAIVAITIVAVVLDALFRRPPPDAAVAAAPR